MRLTRLWVGIVLWLAASAASWAQEVWVQIEARPTLAEAEERARAYANVFPNVAGFAMSTGWYAIALGPFSAEAAADQLAVLKGERLIPDDSYISDGRRFGRQFWPVGGAVSAPAPVAQPLPDAPAPAAPAPTTTATETVILPAALPDETPAEARRSEAALSAEERKEIQAALQWYGHYQGAIDGAFGAGTRRSMASWQSSVGLEGTGILTTAQRDRLLSGYRAERAAIGLADVSEDEAGIEITLPLALVEFDRYQAPFVHFKERNGSGYRVLLISQAGDRKTLAGLYDLMQRLEVVPLEGERSLSAASFVLTGQNETLQSYTMATLKGGLIKGFTLISPAGDAARAARVLEAMKAGFRPRGDHALDDSLGAPIAVSRDDLVSGLAVRRPILMRSGFFVDASGRVATVAEVVKGCGRITIDGDIEMTVAALDEASGVALLAPATALAPTGVARLKPGASVIGAEVAVAGYSYPGTLSEAVVTFGRLADTRDLSGNDARARLEIRTLDGDVGGPVLDVTGQVIGMLLPSTARDGRILPDDVALAVDAAAIRSVMAAADRAGADGAVAADTVTAAGALAPEDIARMGRDMTVEVSCWE